MTAAMTFGEFFKELRLRKGLTLRQYCLEYGHDPGNISKIERGQLPAPRIEGTLRAYASSLDVEEGTDTWLRFFDLAAVSNQTYGIQAIHNKELLNRLPLLFRTLDNKELTEQKLDQLLDIIRKS